MTGKKETKQEQVKPTTNLVCRKHPNKQAHIIIFFLKGTEYSYGLCEECYHRNVLHHPNRSEDDGSIDIETRKYHEEDSVKRKKVRKVKKK